jgi:hypothetical protein
MFASDSLIEHILRGAAGLTALWLATAITADHPWASLAPGAFMLAMFRGCPICWTIGQFETASRHWRRR